MRFIYFLLISLVFTACGHNKLRFSRVDQKQKVVEINEISAMKKQLEAVESVEITATQQTEEFRREVESTSNSASTNVADASTDESSSLFTNEILPNIPETVEDSTELSKKEVDAITQEALLAEKDGTRSMLWSIMVLIFSVLAVISLILAFGFYTEILIIFAGIFGIAVIVSLVLSYIFGIRSLRSRYNTPLGRKRAIVGIAISSIYATLMLLNLVIGML